METTSLAPEPPAWEHFEHEADVGVRGTGRTLAEAFEQAALALTAVITDPAAVRDRETVEVALEGSDPELLLVDWLNAIIYEMAVRSFLFGRFEVSLEGGMLTARISGEPVDRGRHHPAVEPKAATYTALRVAVDAKGNWVAQCVIDV
jgi:SHS2 domain-containing protein